MRLDVDENYVDLVEIGEDALYPLALEALREACLCTWNDAFRHFQRPPGE
jgi:hypothetical protein